MTLKYQLGEDWHRLHPSIRKRFSKDPTSDNPIIYKGVMSEIRCSKMGSLFAQFTRIIGNPLTPYSGKNIHSTVKLFKKCNNQNNVCWERTYHYPQRHPFSGVTAMKIFWKKQTLIETIKLGFGMFFNIYIDGSKLCFKSYRYFWKLWKWHIPLPHIFCPGEVIITHENLDQEGFRFTLAINHPILEKLFSKMAFFMSKPYDYRINIFYYSRPIRNI